MRLGAQEVLLGAGTLARELYGRDVIIERHRHRYEFNNNYLERIPQRRACGSRASRATAWWRSSSCPTIRGSSPRQFHPEFTSTPRDGHPLFTGFIRAARAHRASQLPQAAAASA